MKYVAQTYTENYHRFTVYRNTIGKNPVFYHFSDVHFDNPHCNREAFFRHLKQAKQEKAFLTIAGDFFCLMNGKYDPRRSKSGIRNEYNSDDYLDLVINDAADKLMPYAHNILMISSGNHETAIRNKLGTDPIQRLIERINYTMGSQIVKGNYSGYYTISIQKSERSNSTRSFNVAYDHGHWGGIISKGTQGVVRYTSVLPQADIIHTGHTHDSWIVPHPTYFLDTQRKVVKIKNKWVIRTGTYKEEFALGKGWANEKIFMPKFIGCARTQVIMSYTQKEDTEVKFQTSIIEA